MWVTHHILFMELCRSIETALAASSDCWSEWALTRREDSSEVIRSRLEREREKREKRVRGERVRGEKVGGEREKGQG